MPLERGYLSHVYWVVDRNGATHEAGGMIEESYLTINVNGYTLASMMSSPIDQEALAVGFLYNEGVLRDYSEIEQLQVDEANGCVNVQLKTRNVHLRRQMILTSGCGGGMTFQQLSAQRGRVETEFTTTTDIILDRLEGLRDAANLYNKVRGVHTAVLCSETESLYAAEDVGRHNTVDKIAGKVVKDGFDPRNCILITSGRISSEMIGKANRMNIAVVVSRTAPTSISVQLAEVWEICLVGYARRDAMRIYTHPERLGLK